MGRLALSGMGLGAYRPRLARIGPKRTELDRNGLKWTEVDRIWTFCKLSAWGPVGGWQGGGGVREKANHYLLAFFFVPCPKVILCLILRPISVMRPVVVVLRLSLFHRYFGCFGVLESRIHHFQNNSEKAGTVDFKKHPAQKVGTRSRQCGPKVSGRSAFPGARNPSICSISRFGKIFSSNFPGVFPELSCRTPAQTPETATAFFEVF